MKKNIYECDGNTSTPNARSEMHCSRVVCTSAQTKHSEVGTCSTLCLLESLQA
jgi:hypothetical protein